MRKNQARVLASLAVVALAAAAGLYTSAGLAPERLRWEVERLLERATGSPASMGSLRLVVGFPIHLAATDLRLWDGGLTIDRAIARIDAFSLLTGRPRLSRLTLFGGHLKVRRAWRADQPAWSPQPFARLAERAGAERPEPFLTPLHGIEATVRFLLSRSRIADTLQVQDSHVSYTHDFSDAGGGIETLWFAGIDGVLRHSRLRGDASLFTAARLLAIDGPRGSVEWEGTRSREGVMRISMAATELELATLVPYLNEGRRDSRLNGRLSGVADYATATPGEGRLSLDLVVRDFASEVASDAEGNTRSVAVDAFSTRMEVALDAGYLELSNARIWGSELGFSVEAMVERPLRPESSTGLAVSLEDIDLTQASALLGWLPGRIRERAQKIADSDLSGRISSVELRGGAELQQWRDALTGRTDGLPRGLQVLADVEDVGIAMSAANRLESMNARVTWRDDRLIVEGATGTLNGAPLPRLDLSVGGIGRLFASQRRSRMEPASAVPLTGLTPLWTVLSERRGGEKAAAPPVWIELEHLHHPALFWPLEAVRARFEATQDGAHVVLSRGTWAGVPLRGAIDFTFRPERRAGVWLEAGAEEADSPPEEVAASEDPESPEASDADTASSPWGPWAAGSFEVSATDDGIWLRRSARGRFHAVMGTVQFEDVEVELNPRGELRGSGTLDLAHTDEVPYEVRFALDGGDVSALVAHGGFDEGVATGLVNAQGALSGSLRPGRRTVAGLSGLLRLEASDGTIERSVPPILAVAMASETLSSFSSRDELRYRRCATTLSFSDGRMSTDSFDLEGPDVRLFASGELDLARPPFEIDAEVVLFLFRQIDRALEKIPLLNVLLLGDNNNLVAAYYELVGPWEEPEAVGKPLRTLGEGPGTVLIEQIPKIVRKGMEALGGLLIGPQPLLQGREQSALPRARRDDA